MNRSVPIILIIATIAVAQLSIDLGSIEVKDDNQPVALSYSNSVHEDTLQVSISLATKGNVYIYSDSTHFFRIASEFQSGLGELEIRKPAPSSHTNFDGSIVNAYHNGQIIVLRASIRDTEWSLTASFRFQACDRIKCFMPTTKSFRISSDSKHVIELYSPVAQFGLSGPMDPQPVTTGQDQADHFSVAGRLTGYANAEKLLSFLDAPAEYSSENALAGRSILMVFVLVVEGGLALNLTPCVLPMIPITISVIGAGAQAQSRWRGFLLGSSYGLGITLAYGVLGLLVVTTGGTFLRPQAALSIYQESTRRCLSRFSVPPLHGSRRHA